MYMFLLVRKPGRSWQSNVVTLNGHPIWFKSGATRVVYSDAVIRDIMVGMVPWSRKLPMVHGLSMKPLWFQYRGSSRQFIKCWALLHQDHIVKWFTDNQNVTRIVQAGSRGGCRILETGVHCSRARVTSEKFTLGHAQGYCTLCLHAV